MRLILYRILSVFIVVDLVAIVYFITTANLQKAYLTMAIIPAILITQVFIIRCRCGCRPGLWLLAIWTMLLDFELYFTDTLLLRRCPKCNRDLQQKDWWEDA
uniref:Uncharacterized protein n=1 Tax=Citrifermentans bremense TaxID=60035 RepID=A0A6S6M2N6_9BACT